MQFVLVEALAIMVYMIVLIIIVAGLMSFSKARCPQCNVKLIRTRYIGSLRPVKACPRCNTAYPSM